MTYYAQLVLNGVIAGSIYALFAVGLTMVYGVFRFINFAHGELIAWGAYLVLLFMHPPVSLPLYVAVLPALVVTVVIGLGQDRYVYRPLIRGKRITLLIASIGLSYFLRNAIRLIWGSDLRTYGISPSRGLMLAGLPVYLIFCALLTLLAFLTARRLGLSPFGRALKVVREDEYVAQALGKNVLRLKIKAVTVGSILAGLAGCLWAHYITYISPSDFTLNETILVLLCVVLGGRGTNWGPLLGAFLIMFFQESLRFLPLSEDLGRLVAPLQGMVYGGVLVLIMLKRPEGIISEYRGKRC